MILEISTLIEKNRRKIYAQANRVTVLLFWEIGYRVNNEILSNQRAGYGKQVINLLSAELTIKYGRSFEVKNLRRMIQFSKIFSDFEIVVSLSRQLSWSHFWVLIH